MVAAQRKTRKYQLDVALANYFAKQSKDVWEDIVPIVDRSSTALGATFPYIRMLRRFDTNLENKAVFDILSTEYTQTFNDLSVVDFTYETWMKTPADYQKLWERVHPLISVKNNRRNEIASGIAEFLDCREKIRNYLYQTINDKNLFYAAIDSLRNKKMIRAGIQNVIFSEKKYEALLIVTNLFMMLRDVRKVNPDRPWSFVSKAEQHFMLAELRFHNTAVLQKHMNDCYHTVQTPRELGE